MSVEVSESFILNEIYEMKNVGFTSVIITNNQSGSVVGLCDYRLGDCVYLSLLMINGRLAGRGIGGKIYKYLESEFINQKAGSVRIDVVDDYEGNTIGFWEKQGFISQEKVILEWHGKKSNAQI